MVQENSEFAPRTTDMAAIISRPLPGLTRSSGANPTDESVGYYHSSASPTFAAKAFVVRASLSLIHAQDARGTLTACVVFAR